MHVYGMEAFQHTFDHPRRIRLRRCRRCSSRTQLSRTRSCCKSRPCRILEVSKGLCIPIQCVRQRLVPCNVICRGDRTLDREHKALTQCDSSIVAATAFEKGEQNRTSIPFSMFEMLSGFVKDFESAKCPSLTSCASDSRLTLASFIWVASTWSSLRLSI